MRKTLQSKPRNGGRGGRPCRQDLKSQDGSFRVRATWSFRGHSLRAVARQQAIRLCRIWTALMLKRAIRFVESTQERDCWDLNLNKTEVLAALRWTHDEIMDGPPLPPVRPHPFDDDHPSRRPRCGGQENTATGVDRRDSRISDRCINSKEGVVMTTTTMW